MTGAQPRMENQMPRLRPMRSPSGPPISVPPDASSDDLERVRRELEDTLNRMTIKADEAVLRAGP